MDESWLKPRVVRIHRGRRVRQAVASGLGRPQLKETTMKANLVWAAAALAVVTLSWTPARAAYVQSRWCANSGYDNGPPRERGPGTGPFWSGEPTDCRSIWRK